MRWPCVVCVLCLALSSTPVAATDYFFAATGSNSNPCTELLPCLTLTKAESLSLNPGDRILLKAGDTFAGTVNQFQFPWSGSTTQPITLGAYGSGDRPILDGNNNSHNAVECFSKSNVVIRDVRVTDWLKGIWIIGCTNVTVTNVEVDTIWGECVHFRNASSDGLVDQATIHNCGTGQNGEGVYVGTDPAADGGVPDVTQNITIQNSEIYNVPDEPIEMKSGTRNVSVLNNYIHDAVSRASFGGGILANPMHSLTPTINPNHLIQGNTIRHYTGVWGYGIYCRTGCRIYQNIVDGSEQAGIYVQYSSATKQAVQVLNNTIVNNGAEAIKTSGSPTLTSTNNLARDNASGNTAFDPLFANTAGNDYRLCTSAGNPHASCADRSPAIDAGVQVGLAFQGAAPDLGAIESTDVTPPNFTSNLVMHLKFDEGTGSTAEDSTANDHDGTLGSGADWGAAQMGASALTLDGTTDGRVTVTGELGTPSAVTLSAWIKPAAFPGTRSEVVTIGDHVILRITSTQFQGLYYTGTAWVTTAATSTPSTTVWTHVAYTVSAGAQRLYVNGVLVATSASGAAPSYSGLGSDTLIGVHGNAGTSLFQGSIDDVRMYNRALSSTDIAGLADLEDPPPLSVQITAPTTNPNHSVSSATFALGGVASDATGVTGITWTCPTCTPTSGTATCTPACTPATLFTNWSIPTVTLAADINLVTVTAADAEGTKMDSLTVTYTPLVVSTCTHYASSTGGGSGMSEGSPFTVASFWAVATPGTTLCLLDGTYTGGNAMVTPPAGLSGSVSLPITVRALNDGAVLLDGENVRIPVSLALTNSRYVIEGLNGRNGTTAVFSFLGDNNIGRRLIGWNGTSGQANARIFTLRGLNSVIEDCAGWGDNARVILGGSDSTAATGGGYRRCFFEWNDHPTGTLTSGKGLLSGNGQTYENIIGTVNKTGD